MSNNNLQKSSTQGQPEKGKSFFEGVTDFSKEQTPAANIQQSQKDASNSYKPMDPSFHGTEFILGFFLAFVAMFISKKMFKN